jgi:hypothetical protein
MLYYDVGVFNRVVKLTEWVSDSRAENENLDVFLQIVRLLSDSGKGQGIVSPALYEVDSSNNVIFLEAEPSQAPDRSYRDFKAPEGAVVDTPAACEKRDVFSLGLLLYYILNQKICPVNRSLFRSAFRKRLDSVAIEAADSQPVSMLMEQMTHYEPSARPSLKRVLEVLGSGICSFGILLENTLTGEHHAEITRSFASSPTYKFTPESEYLIDLVTVSPVCPAPLLIPFRLVKKRYILKVAYSAPERWNNLTVRETLDPQYGWEFREEADTVPKTAAALCFCERVYGINGNSLFCETDGLTYEMGYYERHIGVAVPYHPKQAGLVREGSIAVPERLEARILSILRESGRAVYDVDCVGVYGERLPAGAIKTINDMFPETVRIYKLSGDDLLKGAAIYLEKKAEDLIHEV